MSINYNEFIGKMLTACNREVYLMMREIYDGYDFPYHFISFKDGEEFECSRAVDMNINNIETIKINKIEFDDDGNVTYISRENTDGYDYMEFFVNELEKLPEYVFEYFVNYYDEIIAQQH